MKITDNVAKTMKSTKVQTNGELLNRMEHNGIPKVTFVFTAEEV